MILNKLSDDVFYYEDVVDNIEDLKKMIDESEGNDEITKVVPAWDTWEACSGECYIYGSKKNLVPENIDLLSGISKEISETIIEKIRSGMNKVCEDWAKEKNISDPINLAHYIGINRYKAGTFMGGHYDQQEGDTRLLYSLVMYLNDDYEGGEISFTIAQGPLDPEQKPDPTRHPEGQELVDFWVKPKAGSVIIFPASSPHNHTAHEVKSGYKYMVPGFWMNKEIK